jgi:septal ring factor EnvC (AmiA/AmiB activator)
MGMMRALRGHANRVLDGMHRVRVASRTIAAILSPGCVQVLDKVAPLERELQGLMASLQSSQERLAHCQQELGELDSAVVRLKADFQRKTSEAESLKIGLQRAEATLQSAASLLDKLADEKERWSSQVGAPDGRLVALHVGMPFGRGATVLNAASRAAAL